MTAADLSESTSYPFSFSHGVSATSLHYPPVQSRGRPRLLSLRLRRSASVLPGLELEVFCKWLSISANAVIFLSNWNVYLTAELQ